VGLVLALVLARHGAGSLVLEARPAPTPAEESRAITWMPRGLELLGWLGLAERFRERGLARHAHQFRARSTVRRSSPSRPATATTAPTRPSPTSSWPTRPSR
jgi:2-polyprenyl-6-methoxyphenol hydroxylase-like FAD-dependent oxidoreductase